MPPTGRGWNPKFWLEPGVKNGLKE